MKKEVIAKSKNNIEYPKSIKVILTDMVYIDKANLDGVVKNSFRRLATFANPEFYQKQKLRMSVYNIPMVIDCSKEDEKYLKLPRGTYEYLERLCNANKIKIIKTDKRFKGTKIDANFNGELRDEQQLALDNLLKYDNGILCAPTGFVKTVIGCKMIEERKVNTLILVNKIQLLNQWKDRIKEFLNINEVGEISGKKKNITNIIDVASIKSLWNNGDVLFLTMPISGQTRVTQYAGRLHRKDSNKKEILIYDYIDDNFAKTRNMFLKRKKTYEKLGYEIIEDTKQKTFSI